MTEQMATQLPMRALGKQGLQASAQGLGCMSLSMGPQEQLGPASDRIAVIHRALSSGVTLLDTADMYGPYANHVLIGIYMIKPADQLRLRHALAYAPAHYSFPELHEDEWNCRQSHQGYS